MYDLHRFSQERGKTRETSWTSAHGLLSLPSLHPPSLSLQRYVLLVRRNQGGSLDMHYAPLTYCTSYSLGHTTSDSIAYIYPLIVAIFAMVLMKRFLPVVWEATDH